MAACIFCGSEIMPEPSLLKRQTKNVDGYLFECDNCGAIYETEGKRIPDITIYNRPIVAQSELNFVPYEPRL